MAAASIWWRKREANPGVGLIGCEPFVNGVAMALGAIERSGVENVRLHAGDARDLIELLPAGVLGRVFLLYPDPWPKTRHARRRFASRENLALLAPAVKAGGRASDRDRYRGLCRACGRRGGGEPGLAGGGGRPGALGGLAGDPLRGEGAGGGAGAAVPDGRAGVKCVITRVQFPVKRGS